VDVVEPASGGSLLFDFYSDACPSVVQSYESRRNVDIFDCCPDMTFPDITIKLKLASR